MLNIERCAVPHVQHRGGRHFGDPPNGRAIRVRADRKEHGVSVESVTGALGRNRALIDCTKHIKVVAMKGIRRNLR